MFCGVLSVSIGISFCDSIVIGSVALLYRLAYGGMEGAQVIISNVFLVRGVLGYSLCMVLLWGLDGYYVILGSCILLGGDVIYVGCDSNDCMDCIRIGWWLYRDKGAKLCLKYLNGRS